MDKVCGVTFAAFSKRGTLKKASAKESLDTLIENTNANTIALVPNVLQDTPHSEVVNYTSEATFSDEELKETIDYIHSRGLKVFLKPTVNCLNGTWRAFISFFEEDVPPEPKWSNWFKSYTECQVHFAKLAEECKVEFFSPGCEMVMSDHREAEWRQVIAAIRSVYSGLITYNCDKYQEHNVTWWDCVDIISSSGYYPINDWENQLDRIEKVVKKYNKPFMFAEIGCMSTSGSSMHPNDWTFQGERDDKEQADWYNTMFEHCKDRGFIDGICIWDWPAKLCCCGDKDYLEKGYNIHEKPAEKIVFDRFSSYK